VVGGVEVKEWIDEVREKLARADEANQRLSEALETDSLPLEAVAASEAMADLWEYMVWITSDNPSIERVSMDDDNDLADAIHGALTGIRDAICRPGVPFKNRHGGNTGDLTEATIYVAQALDGIADSISDLAEAIREAKQ